jgi:ABC-2 type transport system ATP-binding protein
VPHAVEITGLNKNFGGEHALHGVSLDVPEGSLFGIIGADGAGKTTLIRILTTLIAPDSGGARVLSHDIRTGHRTIRTLIGYMPQKFSLYEDLSVRENMHFFADIFGVPAAERSKRIERLLSFSRLGPFASRRARNLSGGMRQKLALSCALVHTPNLLVLDEPTTGVDPVSRKEFWRILHELNQDGVTILVTTPYMDEAEYCSQLVLLHNGGVLLNGTPAELVEGYRANLFQVSGSEGPLHYPHQSDLPEQIALMYPLAGNLHVATDLAADQQDLVLQRVKSVVPEASRISPVSPRIEDLFFYMLSSHDPDTAAEERA